MTNIKQGDWILIVREDGTHEWKKWDGWALPGYNIIQCFVAMSSNKAIALEEEENR